MSDMAKVKQYFTETRVLNVRMGSPEDKFQVAVDYAHEHPGQKFAYRYFNVQVEILPDDTADKLRDRFDEAHRMDLETIGSVGRRKRESMVESLANRSRT